MLDWIVVLFCLCTVFIVAFVSRRKEMDSSASVDDIVGQQYLAGRSLGPIESLGSIIATEVSALTFIGIPAYAYGKDFSFLHFYIGALIGRLIIAQVIVPKIYNKGLTLYSIIAKDGATEWGKKCTALIYAITKLLSVGVRLYAGSILVAEFFTISIYWALLIITVMTFAYTLIGGLKAVVRTDLIQMGLFVFGGLVAHYLIPKISGHTWSDLMNVASVNGHTWLFSFERFGEFMIGFSGGILFDICTHGVDQDYAQRLMGAKSEKQAKVVISVSTFFSISVGLLFLSIGALLYGFYHYVPVPAGIKEDEIFAHFITTYFPPGIKGLMLAGVLAATMSTLDSTINALSSVLWSDLLPHRNVDKIKSYIVRDTQIISVLLFLIAVVASKSSGVLVLGLKVASWSGGALSAIFFAQLVWPRIARVNLNTYSVIGAYAVNLIFVCANTFVIKGPWQWNVYYGMVGATLFLILFRLWCTPEKLESEN